jgi:hypothetical protein
VERFRLAICGADGAMVPAARVFAIRDLLTGLAMASNKVK